MAGVGGNVILVLFPPQPLCTVPCPCLQASLGILIVIIHRRCKDLEVQGRRTESLRPENDFYRFYLILLFNSLYRTLLLK